MRKKNMLTGLPKKELMQALDDADQDRNGQLSLDEFEVVISRLLRKKRAGESGGGGDSSGAPAASAHRKLAQDGSTSRSRGTFYGARAAPSASASANATK